MKKVTLHKAFIWYCPVCASGNHGLYDHVTLTDEEALKLFPNTDTDTQEWTRICVPKEVVCDMCGELYEAILEEEDTLAPEDTPGEIDFLGDIDDLENEDPDDDGDTWVM